MSTQAPAALQGTWTVDPAASSVTFDVKHFGVATVRGRFSDVEAALEVDEDLRGATARGRVGMASIDTGDDKRDAGLRAEVLEVDAYPEMTFRSTAFSARVGDRFEVTVDLTLHGVTKPLTLSGTLSPIDAGGRIVAAFTGKLQRSAYGVRFPATSNAIVGDKVNVALRLSLVRQP